MIRQGDVLLIPINKLPEHAMPLESRVVVPGNNGHDHGLQGPAGLFESERERYVKVERPAVLTHDEHAHIPLPTGTYRVYQQRQYHPLRYRPAPD